MCILQKKKGMTLNHLKGSGVSKINNEHASIVQTNIDDFQAGGGGGNTF
jgi:hypothetical protein